MNPSMVMVSTRLNPYLRTICPVLITLISYPLTTNLTMASLKVPLDTLPIQTRFITQTMDRNDQTARTWTTKPWCPPVRCHPTWQVLTPKTTAIKLAEASTKLWPPQSWWQIETLSTKTLTNTRFQIPMALMISISPTTPASTTHTITKINKTTKSKAVWVPTGTMSKVW